MMKNLRLLKFKFLFPIWFTFQLCSAQGFLKTADTRIVNADQENVLLRGIGLGGYMVQEGYMLKVPFSGQQHVIKAHIRKLIGKQKTADFYTAWRNNFIQKADIDSLKNWGFNSVRLPMHYNLYTLPVSEEPIRGKNTWLKTGFALTDSLVKWCKANKMYLILDMHATPGGQGHDVNISDRDPHKPSLWESPENQQKLIDLWVKLAKRYKNEPTVAGYDIINEPNWSFEKGINKNGTQDTKNEPLRELMKRITKAIRKVDQKHIIIIEGNGWGNNYQGILPPWDNNMVLSFHKYWNNNSKKAIQQFLNYRKKYKLPIWLGESGENSNAWYTDAIYLMEKNNIGWCWWPLKKLGSNNPLEIKINPGYANILKYWRGKAKKPTVAQAYKGLMQLAENIKIQNCKVQKGVLDAMFRQPHLNKPLPYKKGSIGGSGFIKAIDYDMGREGQAYHDEVSGNYYVSTGGNRQAWNIGGKYRNDGVDIFSEKKGRNSTMYVGDLQNGEWLRYTFTVENAGRYKVVYLISSKKKGSKVEVIFNKNQTQKLKIPDTRGVWKKFKSTPIVLKQGKNQLKFHIDKGGFNFKKISFQRIQ